MEILSNPQEVDEGIPSEPIKKEENAQKIPDCNCYIANIWNFITRCCSEFFYMLLSKI